MKHILSFLALVIIMPAVGQAEATRKAMCRGGNIPVHIVQMREAVRNKLTENGIKFKRVAVSFYKIKRPRATLPNTFGDGLVLGDGSTPSVTYAGAFPTPEACTISAKLRIMVVYEGEKTITNTDVTVPGTMLWRKPVRFSLPEDLD